MHTTRSLFFVIAFILLTGPAAAQQNPLAGLDKYIESAMEEWGVPGMAVAVVKDDEVIFARGFGVQELGGEEPVDEHTLFAIASTTKAFTVAALGMLVDEGKLDWDDPVREHLPEFELSDPYVTREVTVRDLLTHRIGLASHDNVWIAAPIDRDEIVRRARYLPMVHGFRNEYDYNNIMYIVAGEVVEAVSGVSWDDFLEDRIFEPLGMARSTTRDDVVDTRENVSSSHTDVDGVLTPLYLRDYDELGGAGAMFSSAHDMAQWIRLHLGGGMFEGKRLIARSTIEEMHEPQVVIEIGRDDRRLFPDRNFSAYGLGWRVHDYKGYKVVQHTGWVNYMRTQVGMIPSEGIGMVALSNTTTSPLQTAIMYRIFDALLGLPETDWSAKYRELEQEDVASTNGAPSGPRRVEGTKPSVDPARFAGLYTDPLYGDIRVDLEDGQLVIRYSPEYVADLEHWHYDTYRATWRPAGFGRTFATFELDHLGNVKALELRGFTTFRRVGE